MAPTLLPPTIWPAIAAAYEEAQACGAATKTETTFKLVPDGPTGLTFVVREASALGKKPKAPERLPPLKALEQLEGGPLPSGAADDAQPSSSHIGNGSAAEGAKAAAGAAAGQQQRKWHDPFLPPEPQLLVGQLSDSHLLILNKFNVVAHHTLVVTRAFQSQHDPLNASDLAAAWLVLKGMSQGRQGGGLAFYNSGEFSGRSQPHKHLQVVPLPLVEAGPDEAQQQQQQLLPKHSFGPPIEPLVMQAAEAAGATLFEPFAVRHLPYVCYAALLTNGSGMDPSPEDLERTFVALLQKACPNSPLPPPPPPAPASLDDAYLHLPDSPPQPPPGAPSYNTLITPHFMLTVPRSAEAAEGIAINALGYAGTILVRSKEHAAQVEQIGPSNLLSQLGFPWGQ